MAECGEPPDMVREFDWICKTCQCGGTLKYSGPVDVNGECNSCRVARLHCHMTADLVVDKLLRILAPALSPEKK